MRGAAEGGRTWPISCSWESFFVRMLSVVTGFSSDWDLLMLAYLESLAPVERLVVAHLAALLAEL
jgi:hypothetical protein